MSAQQPTPAEMWTACEAIGATPEQFQSASDSCTPAGGLPPDQLWACIQNTFVAAGFPQPIIQDSGVPPVAAPDANTLQTQNGLNAEASYKLAKANDLIYEHLANPATAGQPLSSAEVNAYLQYMREGGDSVFGQLYAINPDAFPVPN